MLNWLLGPSSNRHDASSSCSALSGCLAEPDVVNSVHARRGAPTSTFQTIADNFQSVDEVVDALRRQGLESSNLIVAVDFTKSNQWTGKYSFKGRCLHTLPASPSEAPNPYEQAIAAIGRTLAPFDDDGLIPAYGFGDATTADRAVFSFLPADQPCEGLEAVLARYRQLAGVVRLAGPTSFAPAVEAAMQVVKRSGCQYHILLLVADGQVSRDEDNPYSLSPQEEATVRAICQASHLPLSIVMVGVGDGPWEAMQEFDDKLPQRTFDNFQFVNFTDLTRRYPAAEGGAGQQGPREAAFALHALMEIPEQYKTIKRLGLLGRPNRATAQQRTPMIVDPPPVPTPIRISSQPHSASPAHAQPLGQNTSLGRSASLGPSSAALLQSQRSFSQSYSSRALQPEPLQVLPATTHASLPDIHLRSSGSWGGANGLPPIGPAAAHGGLSALSGSAHGGMLSAQGGAAVPQSPHGAGDAQAAMDPMYICPITQAVMEDPVIAADGHTYECGAIEEWFKKSARSPMTNAPLASKQLIPNLALRSSIKEWQTRHGLR